MTGTATVKIATPSDREVTVTRVFAAPRQHVFDALTKPELLKRWLFAPGRSLEICDVDLKVGGGYRFVFRGPDKKDVGTRGTYREIVAPQKIVNVESWEDWDAGETLVTTILDEKDGQTMFTSTMLFPSREVRDTVLKSGLEKGVSENYDKLDALLASMS